MYTFLGKICYTKADHMCVQAIQCNPYLYINNLIFTNCEVIILAVMHYSEVFSNAGSRQCVITGTRRQY